MRSNSQQGPKNNEYEMAFTWRIDHGVMRQCSGISGPYLNNGCGSLCGW